MAAGRIFIPGWMPALDRNGVPIPDARMFVYENETDVLATIYTDDTLTTPAANPVEANSSGRFPAVWADDADLFSVSMEAPYGPAGVPFTYDGLSPSMSADLLTTAAAEAAADEAAASALAAAEAAAEVLAAYGSIEEIEAAVAAANEGAAIALEAVNQALAIYGSIEAVEAAADEAAASALAAAQSAADAAAALSGKADTDLVNVTNSSFVIWNRNRISVDLRETNTGDVNSALANAACIEAGLTGAEIILPEGDIPMIGNLTQLSGLSAFRGQGRNRTRLNFSGRPSTASLVQTLGSLDATTYALANDVAVGDMILTIPAASVSAAGITAGMKLHLAQPFGVAVDGPSARGEWIYVVAITPGSPNSVLSLLQPVNQSYTVSNSVGVRIPFSKQALGGTKGALAAPIEIEGFSILGTGQAYVSGSDDGDIGINNVYCERPYVDDVYIEGCENVSFRWSHGEEGWAGSRCYSQKSEPQNAAQIQYGFSWSGTGSLWRLDGVQGDKGRHLVNQTGGLGYLQRQERRGCIATNTYSGAYAEHDGLVELVSRDDKAVFCGNGADIRGRGTRKYAGFECYNTVQSHPPGNASGAAFVISDMGSDISITDAKARNCRYLMYAQNFAGNETFAYDEYAPGTISVNGFEASEFTSGFYIRHNGSENVEKGHPGTYNTSPIERVRLEGLRLTCSGQPGTPTVSTRTISVEGYVNNLEVIDCDISYPAGVTPYYAVLSQGVTNTYISGGNWDRSRGVLFGNASVLNEAGATVTRNPQTFTLGDLPAIREMNPGDAWLNTTLGPNIVDYRFGSAIVLGRLTAPITHTGTTTETTLFTRTVKGGHLGKWGTLRIMLQVGVTGTDAKVIRVKFGGTTFLQTTLNTTTVTGRFLVIIQNQGVSSQIGAPANLFTFGTNAAAGVTATIDTTVDQNIIVTTQNGTAGESATLQICSIEMLPG